jgi:hypothetical protein
MTFITDLFLNPTGLWALTAVVLFIIFYIIRPKPRKLIIPSLMFLIKDKGNSNFNSFFQKFFRDFLFFVQLLILLLLALAIAKPYINMSSLDYADTMIFVIDASASMNAKEDGSTRFEKAINLAIENVKGRNTIILATDKSQLIIKNQPRSETIKALNTLKARETLLYNLYDSIIISENFATSEQSAVYVISDFSTNKAEEEFLRAKLYLEAKGISVFFKDISLNKAKNIGIIDLDAREDESTVWIKNFNDKEEEITFKYEEIRETFLLGPRDVKSISFTTLPGESIVEIEVDKNSDDFILDNKAYISMPEESSINIVMVANENEPYLTTVLNLMDKVSLNIQKPPIVNLGNPDLVIIGKINKNILIPGDITKIRELVSESGIPVIILAQDNILDLGLETLMPVELIKKNPTESSEIVEATQENSFITPAEIQFGQIRKYYQARNNDNIITYAHVTNNKYPLITISSYGKGKVLYYGIFDEYSDFKSDIFYPIFWKRAIELLIGGRNPSEINKKTGYVEAFSRDRTVITPDGRKTGNIIALDYNGFYRFPDYTIAANLLTEEEQRLNRGELSLEISNLEYHKEKSITNTKQKELIYIMVIIAGFILFFELLFLKLRGDV